MKPEIQAPKEAQAVSECTSLAAKLVNVLVSPSEVFDEVLVHPIRPAVWMVPTLLVCLASLLLLIAAPPPVPIGVVGETTGLDKNWHFISAVAVLVSAVAGTFWSASVLWGISRVFLKSPVHFLKALEVAALAGMVLVLGTVVTALLMLATGNASARPALSLMMSSLDAASGWRAVLDVCNVFYLWSTGVLAVGLSRLTGVTLKEGAFWAFGYWLVLRISLILLG